MRGNREAILRAARGLMADSPRVPMARVAEHAHVGRATLYRNFPDRQALTVAVLEEDLDRLDRLVARRGPDALIVLLEEAVAGDGPFVGLAPLVWRETSPDAGCAVARARIAALIAAGLRRAQAAGLVRREITVDDILLCLAMVRGAIEGVEGRDARRAAARRALMTVLKGIYTRPAVPTAG